MTDLTKITTPFGLLDKDTQDALKSAFGAGVKIEAYASTSWGDVLSPQWFRTITYRAKPKPVRVEIRRPLYDSDGLSKLLGWHWITCNEDGTEPTVTWEPIQ